MYTSKKLKEKQEKKNEMKKLVGCVNNMDGGKKKKIKMKFYGSVDVYKSKCC